jgi:predicted dehydrogenase
MQNILIAGFGFMGGMHAQVYRKLPSARIAGVVDSHPALARRAMDKIGLKAPLFRSLEEALVTVPSTVVDLCIPTDLHAPLALQAIRAGKHVFCEKPLALRAVDAVKIGAAAAAAGVYGQVGHCIRFWPEYVAFRDFFQSAKAGALLSLSLQRRSMLPRHSVGGWLLDPHRSGGAALDLHIHDTDFILSLLGSPRSVASRTTKDRHGLSHIFTSYHYPQGVVTAEGGWNYPAKWGFQMAFQAVFEKGTVEYDSGASPSLSVTLGTAPRKALPFRQPSIGASVSGTGNLASLGGYFNELQYFVGCLERGLAPKVATFAQATQSLRVTLAEIRSAQTGGRPVVVQSPEDS